MLLVIMIKIFCLISIVNCVAHVAKISYSLSTFLRVEDLGGSKSGIAKGRTYAYVAILFRFSFYTCIDYVDNRTREFFGDKPVGKTGDG